MSKTIRSHVSVDKMRKTKPYKREKKSQLEDLVDWEEDHWHYL
jgi:hypothetical protein